MLRNDVLRLVEVSQLAGRGINLAPSSAKNAIWSVVTPGGKGLELPPSMPGGAPMLVVVNLLGMHHCLGQQHPDRQSYDAKYDDQPPTSGECLPVVTPLHRSPAFSLLVEYSNLVAVPYPAANAI